MIQSEVPKDKVSPPPRTNGQAGPDTKPSAPALPIDLAKLPHDFGQGADPAVPQPELVRLSEGTLASASDEALRMIIYQATALARDGERERDDRTAQREAAFLALVTEQVRFLNIAPKRVFVALGLSKPAAKPAGDNTDDGRKRVAAKYMNPAQPLQTWSGRGKPPPWVEFGEETDPKTGKPQPLRKFWITKDDT